MTGAECILCGKAEFREHWNRLRNDEPGKVVECTNCGLARLEHYDQADAEYYKEKYARDYFTGGKADPAELHQRFSPLQKAKLERVKQYLTPDTNLLEIGSSTGYTLEAFKPFVSRCTGVELNNIHAEYANIVIGIETRDVPLEKAGFAPESFDVVCLYQVLEHIENPVGFLDSIYNLLKPGGYVFIELPTLHNPLISLYKIKEFMDFWYQKPHLYYYTCSTLEKLVGKTQLNTIEMYTVCETSIVNHLNWMLTGTPMYARDDCVRASMPISSDNIGDEETMNRVNALLEKFNSEYSELIQNSGYGDVLFSVCRKEKE